MSLSAFRTCERARPFERGAEARKKERDEERVRLKDQWTGRLPHKIPPQPRNLPKLEGDSMLKIGGLGGVDATGRLER